MFEKASRVETGAAITQGSGKGTLKLRCEWFEPVADRPTPALGTLVSVRFNNLTLPRGLAEAVQLRMHLNGRSVETPVRRTPTGKVISDAAATEKRLKEVVFNGRELGLDNATIAKLTGLTAEVVAEIMGDKSKPLSAASPCSCCACSCATTCCSEEQLAGDDDVIPPAGRGQRSARGEPSIRSRTTINADVNLTLPPGETLDGHVEIELLNSEKERMAVANIALRDFEVVWPRPENTSMKVYTLQGKNGLEVQVEASMVVAGLAAATCRGPCGGQATAAATRKRTAANPTDRTAALATGAQHQMPRSANKSRPWCPAALAAWRK
mmetsp:Transcript_58036/g.114192  ORF Transcript_58036/g.114192 Transcript_58036/m.114192 type:complete len:325 (-) Transcript_58036:191-1165(-)